MAVTALLGPTNTGKTHLALERLLEHRTGMIGFPLRLLARENYDRVVAAKGPEAVALITGEERLLPARPSYFICTVEAMPQDRRVDFVAIDEVQLAADRERGHVFTDRLLRARGLEETWLLGAETARPLLRTLLPDAAHLTRARLSTLRYVPPHKLNRLPRRSAVVVFSLVDLYELAERLRHELGGVAVVFGALSPRTRNAQVGLYQAGEVDFLVATDAIGMGLNLDIEHVAFTRLTKYDGRGPRALRPAEVAQIAGRAGRHVKDGTFGATADLGELDEALVRAVESHRFEPLESLFWRNPELDFRSVSTLVASLEAVPPRRELIRMRAADDQRVLVTLRADADVMALTRAPERVALLWEVCQVPDFRNVLSDAHARLLAQLYQHLTAPARRLPEDWVAAQVTALDRVEGDVDTLLARIAGIRTWTYVSHRADWLADPRHWQQHTRRVEDRLSDALHERLTEQFVDRRGTIVTRADPDGLVTEIGDDGEVRIQGLTAGRLEGFRFVPEPGLRNDARALLAAANRVLREGAPERARLCAAEPDEAFSLGVEGRLAWRGANVARLVRGDGALTPKVDVLASDLLDVATREAVRRRLTVWLEVHLRARLGPLFRLREAETLGGAARGLAFTLGESLGSVPRRGVADLVAGLTPAERRSLAELGVRLGRWVVFLPGLFDASSLRLRALLFSVANDLADLPLPNGHTTAPWETRVPARYYAACGYHPVLPTGHRPRAEGTRLAEPMGSAVWRVDRLERALELLHERLRAGGTVAVTELSAAWGVRDAEARVLLLAKGLAELPDGRFERREKGGRGPGGSRPGSRSHAGRRV